MHEKTTLVVTAVPNPNEMESVQAYLKGVLPLLMGAGGKVVKRLKIDKPIHGKPSGMVLVMDFDSANSVTELVQSEDYAALIDARDRGFSQMNIMLSHEM